MNDAAEWGNRNQRRKKILETSTFPVSTHTCMLCQQPCMHQDYVFAGIYISLVILCYFLYNTAENSAIPVIKHPESKSKQQFLK